MSPLVPGCGRGGATRAGDAAPSALRFPQKAADLILLTDRPPNLEMPMRYLRHDLTPNEAFFVRWHLAGVRTDLDRQTFRLRLRGHVERPLDLSLDDLEKLETVELEAVNQCAGNGRALSAPRVPGIQWTQGALGNARWRGVRLCDLLARAGLRAGAVEVAFRGADLAPLPTVPRFEKSLQLARALDPEVLVAFAMNGAPLPLLNGFPCRLVVPGWYSTYWVKALEEITVTTARFEGYWMAKAYRIPEGADASESPAALAQATRPIGPMNVRSFLVPPDPAMLLAGSSIPLEGVAFDGGAGIRRVEVSADGGVTWGDARLEPDRGRHAFRRFRMQWTPRTPGPVTLLARATSVAGEVQGTPRWNRAGYMRNVPEPLAVSVR